MGNNTGGLIGAALILGVSIVLGSFLLKTSLDRGSAGLKESLAEIKTALESSGRAAPARAAAPRRGPDPNRRYTINTKGAPIKGPKKAKITLVEFSDFQ